MRIVLDLGCATHGGDESVNALIARFHPDKLYGFDPLLEDTFEYERSGTRVSLYPQAAWLHDGTVQFEQKGIRSAVMTGHGTQAACCDLAGFIQKLRADAEVIVKMDVEGAEYALLRHLRERKVDHRISLLLVEWHGDQKRPGMACPVEEWDHRQVAA